MINQTDTILDVEEAAVLLKVTPATVSAWLRDGLLPGRKIGGDHGVWRLSRRALEEFCAGEGVQAKERSTPAASLTELQSQSVSWQARDRMAQPGIVYWGWRVSDWANTAVDAPFLFAELRAGRLRQGWGYTKSDTGQDLGDMLDLRNIRQKRRARQPLTKDEQFAWRGRCMLPDEPDGVRAGDIIFVLHVPRYGQVCLARIPEGVTYRFEPFQPNAQWSGPDYGHIIDAEMLTPEPIPFLTHSAIPPRLKKALALRPRIFRVSAIAEAEAFLHAQGITS